MKFYLPITKVQLHKVIMGTKPNLFDELAKYEPVALSTLYVIEGLRFKEAPEAKELPQIHRLVNVQIRELSKSISQKKQAFIRNIVNDLALGDEEGLMELLSKFKLALTEDYADANKWGYLEHDSEALLLKDQVPWVTNGRELLVDEQRSILDLVLKNEADPLELQGYAGIGKTMLCRLIIQGLKNKHKAHTLYLANTLPQIEKMSAELGEGFVCMSFNQIIYSELRAGEIWGQRNKLPSLNFKEIAERFAFKSLNSFKPPQVASIVSKAVFNFCVSGDPYIKSEHLPNVSKELHGRLIQYAEQLWRATVNEGKSSSMPISWFHRMKLLQLKGTGFTKRKGGHFTHIVIDEAQDMYRAMQHIVSNTRQIPVIKLQDEMQNLTGERLVSVHSGIRKRELKNSFRQGRLVTPLINEQIVRHNDELEGGVQGNPDINTEIEGYKGFGLPNRPTAIFTKSLWKLLQIVIELSKAAKKFNVLPESARRLRMLLDDIVSFNKNETYKLKTGEFNNIKNWEHLIETSQDGDFIHTSLSFLRSSQRIENLKHQLRALNQPKMDGKKYTCGLVGHSKSLEFTNVMLCDDVFKVDETNSKTIASRELYLGLSRGKRRIFIPE